VQNSDHNIFGEYFGLRGHGVLLASLTVQLYNIRAICQRKNARRRSGNRFGITIDSLLVDRISRTSAAVDQDHEDFAIPPVALPITEPWRRSC
jgi:hypothetical protein